MFEHQNDIYRAASGHQESIFVSVQGSELECENCEVIQTEQFLRIERLDPLEEAVVTLRFTAEEDDLYYTYLQMASDRSVSLVCGDVSYHSGRFLKFNEILPLGSFLAGEEVALELHLQEDNLTLLQWETYREDPDALAAHIEALRENEGTLERRSSSHLLWQGTVAPEQGALLLTVPYEENWKAWVDGEEVETTSVLGGFLGVPMDEGEHSVELRYVPRGLKLGITISGLTALGCLVVIGGAFRFVRKCRKGQ